MPINPKYFFRLNKSLHLFETHFAFLPLFNPNIDLLQAVKVTKSGLHLSHDRVSKGYGFIPCLMSQTSFHACLQRFNMMQVSLWHQTRNRPMPLTSSVVWQMIARFCNFYNVKKVKTLVKKAQCVLNRRKELSKGKKIFWGYRHFKVVNIGSGCPISRARGSWQKRTTIYNTINKKKTSVFYASVRFLMMNFLITFNFRSTTLVTNISWDSKPATQEDNAAAKVFKLVFVYFDTVIRARAVRRNLDNTP